MILIHYPLLAGWIVKEIDRGNSIWKKWDGQRELLLKSSVLCWIPTEDMRDFLNTMPGPKLSSTDVAQRLRALAEEDRYSYPNEDFRDGFLDLYNREKTLGTELPAIVGASQEYVENEEERTRQERNDNYRRVREQEQTAREERLLSGADCKWTQVRKSTNWYCRTNGRTFRLTPTKDKMWDLHGVVSASDSERGTWIGEYKHRGDATKILSQLAYRPEAKY